MASVEKKKKERNYMIIHEELSGSTRDTLGDGPEQGASLGQLTKRLLSKSD